MEESRKKEGNVAMEGAEATAGGMEGAGLEEASPEEEEEEEEEEEGSKKSPEEGELAMEEEEAEEEEEEEEGETVAWNFWEAFAQWSAMPSMK